MVTTRPPKTIVKPTALGLVANTDTKLLIYGLFQRDRVLAQDGIFAVGVTLVDVEYVAPYLEALFFLRVWKETGLYGWWYRDEHSVLHNDRARFERAATGLLVNEALRLQIVVKAKFAGVVLKDEQRLLPVWSKYSNAQRFSSLHLSKGCLNPPSWSDTYSSSAEGVAMDWKTMCFCPLGLAHFAHLKWPTLSY